MENDLEYLREQLSQLDEPELPPSLTARALFARLDEGTLALPEDTAPGGPEEPEAKAVVIPWRKLARRWGPLAACLALVLLLHQGYQVGLAKNFANSSGSPSSAPAAGAQVPETAAYDAYNGTEQESVTEDASADGGQPAGQTVSGTPETSAPQEDILRKSMNAQVSSAAPPAPEPEEARPGGPADIGSDDDYAGSIQDPAPRPDPPSSNGGEKPNPDTGGGELNPDSGEVKPTRPPELILDSGPDAPALSRAIRDQMEEIAADHSPDYLLSYRVLDAAIDGEDRLVFDAVYSDESGRDRFRTTFVCLYYEGKGEVWLVPIQIDQRRV